MKFKKWLFENTVFQTEKGSIYEFDGKRSRRYKSQHAGHETADVGWKPQSELTVFINPELAREIGMWNTSSSQGKRLILADKIYLISKNPQSEQYGLDRTYATADFSRTPQIGLSPLELWQQDNKQYSWSKPGLLVFAGNHPGNPIVKIG